MHVDPTQQKVLGYLGRALSLELSAVQLYSTHARVVAIWGLDKPAERFRLEAHEEMEHVERVIAHMLAMGAAPNASQLRPVRIGSDLITLLNIDLQFEMELVSLYQDAVDFCKNEGETNNQLFFQSLLEEERQHAAMLTEWIDSLEQAS